MNFNQSSYGYKQLLHIYVFKKWNYCETDGASKGILKSNNINRCYCNMPLQYCILMLETEILVSICKWERYLTGTQVPP